MIRSFEKGHWIFDNNNDVAMVGEMIWSRHVTDERINEINADMPLTLVDVPMLVHLIYEHSKKSEGSQLPFEPWSDAETSKIDSAFSSYSCSAGWFIARGTSHIHGTLPVHA